MQSWAGVVVIASCMLSEVPAAAADFTVDSTSDTHDSWWGNGTCADASGYCTPRAAIEEANALPGSDTVYIPAGDYSLTYVVDGVTDDLGDPLMVDDDITVAGAGMRLTNLWGSGWGPVFALYGTDAYWTSVDLYDLTVGLGYGIGYGGAYGIGRRGGNIYSENADLYAEDVEITEGYVSPDDFYGPDDEHGYGGGLAVMGGSAWLTRAWIHDNTNEDSYGRSLDAYGGGIYNSGLLFMDGCTLVGNIADSSDFTNGYGGGIANAGTAWVWDTYIGEGGGGTFGGGIYNSGTMDVWASTVRSNTVYADYYNYGYGNGAGISNTGTLSVKDSTVAWNAGKYGTNTQHLGGGLYNSGSLSATNVTVYGNAARTGGGLYNELGWSDLNNLTITQNQAVVDLHSGGAYNASGTVSPSNTIIAQNRTISANADCQGTFTTYGHNLVGVATVAGTSWCGGFSFIANDQKGTSAFPTFAKLGPLTNNGGTTDTCNLKRPSPALDAGDDALCPLTDQRGYARPADGDLDGIATCDIGAFERGAH